MKNNKASESINHSRLIINIKDYIIKWKHSNEKEYERKYGEIKINDLTPEQLHGLFLYATKKDAVLLSDIGKNPIPLHDIFYLAHQNTIERYNEAKEYLKNVGIAENMFMRHDKVVEHMVFFSKQQDKK